MARRSVEKPLVPWRWLAFYLCLAWLAAGCLRVALSERLFADIFAGQTRQALFALGAWAFWGAAQSFGVAWLIFRLPASWLLAGRWLGVLFGAALAGGAVWAFVTQALAPLLAVAGGPVGEDLAPRLLRGWLLFAVVSGGLVATRLARSASLAQERALAAEAHVAAARVDLLRAQLNPHFLFNALNGIVTLIAEDPARAEAMLRALGHLLRRALEPTAATHPLREEVNLLRLYLDLEKMRFEDALEVNIDLGVNTELVSLPTFLLQPLVENAIKHGARGPAQPLRLVVWARRQQDRLLIEVRNSGELAPPASDTQRGLGLANLRARLAALYAGNHGFALLEQDGWVIARLHLPASPA